MADPGFPGARGGPSPIIWHNFCRKLHEHEKKWTEMGHASSRYPRSATAVHILSLMLMDSFHETPVIIYILLKPQTDGACNQL